MEAPFYRELRDQLLVRRGRLEVAVQDRTLEEEARRLLGEVDAALARFEQGTYGLCESCGDPIERERLIADPLMQFCLDHLSPPQRRALEQDVELAARIQGGFLPERLVRADGWEIAYQYQGSGPMSGDTCDIAQTPNGDLHFLVGDVAGKGLGASLLMAHLHASFRALRPLGLSLVEIVGRANRAFCESTAPEAYATLCYGVARASGQVEFCNAGHPSALWFRGQDEITELRSTALPVGLFCETAFSARKFRLAPGDTLLLYTDGVIDCENHAGAAYGADRLARVAAKHRERTPDALVAACLSDLVAFAGTHPRGDDVTIMAVRKNRDGPVRENWE